MTLRVHPDQIVRDSESLLLAIHPTWERTRLAEVADVLNGFAFKSTSFSKSEGTPLLRIRDVGTSGTEANYVGDFDRRYLVEPGSIVVGMDGDFRVARWTGPVALLNQRVCKISVRDEGLYDAAFLFYALPGYLDAINALTSSVTVKHLSSRTVQDIPLPLPPLAEQRRIVAAIEEHFSRLDAAEASLHRALRRLERLRVSSIARVLDGSWPKKPLSEVAETQLGKMLSMKSKTGVGTRPYLRNKNIQWDRVDIADVLEMDFTPKEFEKFRLRDGDVLVCEGGEVGRAAVWRGEIEACCYQKALHRVRSSQLVPEYLVHVLHSYAAQDAFDPYVTGSTIKHLPQEDLRRIPVPVPPPENQLRTVEEIDRQLSIADAMVAEIDRALRRSATLRRSTLGQAMTGKLVPQDPSDEPASVLLERIAAERAVGSKPSREKRKMPT
jgi:type I restriction enzyme, S subunit